MNYLIIFSVLGMVLFFIFRKKEIDKIETEVEDKPKSNNTVHNSWNWDVKDGKQDKSVYKSKSISELVGSAGKPIQDQNLAEMIVDGLEKIRKEFGVDVARWVERIYRIETAHFTSGQFLKTFSPGMEVAAGTRGQTFPFGWTSMKEFWEQMDLIPGFHTMPENKTGIKKTFLKFPNPYTAMRSLALYVRKYRPERWYSTDPVKQMEYRNKLGQITPRIVNKLNENGMA